LYDDRDTPGPGMYDFRQQEDAFFDRDAKFNKGAIIKFAKARRKGLEREELTALPGPGMYDYVGTGIFDTIERDLKKKGKMKGAEIVSRRKDMDDYATFR